MVVSGYATHVVMHGWQYRYRLLSYIHTGKNFRALGDSRQAFIDNFWAKVLQMQVDMISFRPYSATFIDFHRHGSAYHIPRCEILGVGSVALHKAFTLGVGQIAAFTANTLGYQTAGTVNTGGVEPAC